MNEASKYDEYGRVTEFYDNLGITFDKYLYSAPPMNELLDIF